MKLMWFHLMPYTELPEDFAKASPGMGRHQFSLFDSAARPSHANDFMDELEFAAECGLTRSASTSTIPMATGRCLRPI
jgi:hypothetical protein